ncbi:hypothetical protein NQ315_001103 [Exocentrus adspersus]|uniref:PPM-type phosphatase domain-containing protein n=1 Tax=Exocentrus adspersus TaxID=1586481 RepID=A0AAV8WE10_9CUCU|nr:hypothetical protein NQ315_001103 [Exocentrus adspersus]
MVVGCRTPHLIKTGKGATHKFSFTTSSLPFARRNYYNCTKNMPNVLSRNGGTLVRLCCACRRFHSTGYFQASRESRAALSPQESSVDRAVCNKMALQGIILLLAISLVGALDLPQPLQRYRRAVLSEEPVQELRSIFNQDLSRANVQAYINSLLPSSLDDLQRTVANDDLLEKLIKSYAANPRIKRAASDNDVESILAVLNSEIGANVLVIANDSVIVDVEVLQTLLVSQITTTLKELYPNDPLLQIVASNLAQQQVNTIGSNLEQLIAQNGVSVEAISEILALISGGNRAKRDVVTDLLLEILRPQIAAVLVPIQTQFNSIVDLVVNTLLSLYLPSQPSFPLVDLVTNVTNVLIVRAAEVIVVVQTNINNILDNLINGTTTTTTARRRRDLGQDLDLKWEVSHSRVRRTVDIFGFISGTFVSITTQLNLVIKEVFLAVLSSQYATIGTIITQPIRAIFEGIINAALPCDSCASIVDTILRANEYTHEFNGGSVKSYDSNQLASNNPIEDTRSEASCLLTTGFLVGVFDGHGGGACAQVIAKRLYHYITACLLPHENLLQYFLSLTKSDAPDLIQTYNDKVQFVDDIKEIYSKSFSKFVKDLSETGTQGNVQVQEAMQKAFLRLDEDMSQEALPKEGEPLNFKTMSVAMSGAVACVAHIDGQHLHVANVGDCCAVLGTLSETNSWVAKKLLNEHNTCNQSEVDRIIKEHPYNESKSVIKMDRLLGQLAPLRSMGDFRFKWSKEIMNSVVAKHFGDHIVPPNYHTPPYLTALPEIAYHKLTTKDKFLIIGTDGLWDGMTPLQAVKLVGEHMKGKVTLNPLKLPRRNMTLSEINEMLLQRKEGLKMKPKDSNAATHIIRNALGGTEFGIDHIKISELLSLPDAVVRVFRDDITVTIVYFDSEYLSHCPA